MRKIKATALVVPLFVVALTATFQNCDAGFHYDPSNASLSSLGEGDITGVFGIKAYVPGGAEVTSAQSIDSGFDYDIRATGTDVSSAILTFTLPSTNTAGCSLTATANPTKRTMRCSSSGSVTINLRAIWPDETISSVSMTRAVGSAPVTATPAPSNDPNVVNFTIVAGTGANPWNTQGNPVRVFVGQTLRLLNNDSVAHRLHTDGSPFPHQETNEAAPPNGSASILIRSAHALNGSALYDHDLGTGSRFWIESTDGRAQYSRNFNVAGAQQSCASCHGPLANSLKRGTSYTTLNNAIANNSGGMGALNGLTESERRAIVYELNK